MRSFHDYFNRAPNSNAGFAFSFFFPNRFAFFSVSLQLLQNLGKVDRTADEIFDEHLTNFNRQQNNAARLQKEFNNYIRCVRGEFTAHS